MAYLDYVWMSPDRLNVFWSSLTTSQNLSAYKWEPRIPLTPTGLLTEGVITQIRLFLIQLTIATVLRLRVLRML